MPLTKCVRYQGTTTDDATYAITGAATTSNALKTTEEQYDCYFIDTRKNNMIVILNSLKIPCLTYYTSIKQKHGRWSQKKLGWLDFTSEESELLEYEGFTDFEEFLSTTNDELKSMINGF